MESLLSQLSNIDASSFQDADSDRTALIKAARKLIQRVERPYERAYRMVYTDPALMTAVKIAIDLDVFSKLSRETPRSVATIAAVVQADSALLGRLLRLMATCEVIIEDGEDMYRHTDFSDALKDRDGIRNGIFHFYDVAIPQMAKLPEYFKQNAYQCPTDNDHPPLEYILGATNFWSWLQEHSPADQHFNNFLATARRGQPPWPSYYPIHDRLLQDFTSEKPLVVDVGGGIGRDLSYLAHVLPDKYKNARLILQDLPSVIESAQKESLDPRIRPMAHSFFNPQPSETQGAKAYFLHSILHDWPENKALEILTHVRAAMEPGYTKVLPLETAMPERAKDVPPIMAALDISMMSNFAALERTKKQWMQLLERAGLRWVEFHGTKGFAQGIIEVDLL